MLQDKSNIFEILNLRSQWEELANNLNTDANSSIPGLKDFVEHSHQNNRFKQNWSEAMNVAKEILEKAC